MEEDSARCCVHCDQAVADDDSFVRLKPCDHRYHLRCYRVSEPPALASECAACNVAPDVDSLSALTHSLQTGESSLDYDETVFRWNALRDQLLVNAHDNDDDSTATEPFQSRFSFALEKAARRYAAARNNHAGDDDDNARSPSGFSLLMQTSDELLRQRLEISRSASLLDVVNQTRDAVSLRRVVPTASVEMLSDAGVTLRHLKSAGYDFRDLVLLRCTWDSFVSLLRPAHSVEVVRHFGLDNIIEYFQAAWLQRHNFLPMAAFHREFFDVLCNGNVETLLQLDLDADTLTRKLGVDVQNLLYLRGFQLRKHLPRFTKIGMSEWREKLNLTGRLIAQQQNVTQHTIHHEWQWIPTDAARDAFEQMYLPLADLYPL